MHTRIVAHAVQTEHSGGGCNGRKEWQTLNGAYKTVDCRIMTKLEIVTRIALNTGTETTAVAVVENLMEQVRESLIGGENFYLRGFGIFLRKCRKAKKARNITKNTTIVISEHDIPAFNPSSFFTIK